MNVMIQVARANLAERSIDAMLMFWTLCATI